MGLLDAHDQFVSNKCKELTKQNSTFEKVTEALGLTNLVQGVQGFMEEGIVANLVNSPLRELGEDVLAQTITDNARRLSQNLLNQVSEKQTKTLTDLRATAFNAVFATMTFKNDMVLYFASTVAQEAVDAIKEKRRTLISLQESVRELHNALLVLAGGGPFFNAYIQDLRTALIKIEEAERKVFLVQSAFFSTLRFPQGHYASAKSLLQEAHELIMPPVTGEDAEALKKGFLKGVFQNPSYGRQLGMLTSIPKLTFKMLQQYDLYALKVLKVNVLLLGFQSIIQNLQEVTGGKFKDLVLDQLASSQAFMQDIIDDMSLQVNGAEGLVGSVAPGHKPNPTKTSAKAVSWGVRVKAAQVMLEVLDPDALQTLSISNAGLQAYYSALNAIAAKDDKVTALAVLKATDGREQPGGIEPDMITFAFQANQAIVDKSLLESDSQFNSNTVLALGSKLNARLQLSIDQDREIEQILLRYIKTVAPVLDGIKALGDSMFSLLDGLGMDRASDALKKGGFADFFAMNGRTANYIGAGIAGLSAIQALTTTNAQRECLQGAINKLKIEDTSKKLAAQRSVQQNVAKLQKTNEAKCKKVKESKKKVDGCASGIDLGDLRDNPLKTLSGAFAGIFGGDVADSLGGTFGDFASGKADGGNLGVSNLDIAPGASSVFSSTSASVLAAQDSVKSAVDATTSAKAEMAGAINKVEGYKASATESLGSLSTKLESAKKVASGDVGELLEQAGVSKDIANIQNNEAGEMLKNVDNVKKVFPGGASSKSVIEGLSGSVDTSSLPGFSGSLKGLSL